MLVHSDRKLEVDLLKAAGILAVVTIHSLRDFWNPGFTASELWIGQMMRFGVPAFLAVSGFLYAVPPASWPSIGPRLRRILVPYLLASAFAIALGLWQGELNMPPSYMLDTIVGTASDTSTLARTTAALTLDIALGNAFGPYYYVGVISFFVLVSPMIALLSRRGLTILLLIALSAQVLFEGGFWYWNDFFWHVRNPALWAGYFVTGWYLRVHAETIKDFVQSFRPRLLASATGLTLCCATLLAFESTGALPHFLVQLTAWVGVYGILGVLFLSASGRQTRSIWLTRISDLTYTIYLFHLFVLYPIRKSIGVSAEGFDPFVLIGTAALSFLVPFSLALGLRSLFGEKTRIWIGA